MREALHIFKKDSRGLRVPIALVLAWTVVFVYGNVTTLATYDLPTRWRVGFAYMLLRYAPYILGLGWVYLIAQVVHADALHGDRQFWLTRPHRRWSLLLGKMLFVIAYVAAPLAAAHVVILMATGFPLAPSLPALLTLEGVLLGSLFIPLLALSSTTASIGWLVAMIAPTPVFLAAFQQNNRGLGSLDWVAFFAASLLLIVVAALVLWVQFGFRRTRLSQLIILAGIGGVFAISGIVDWDRAYTAQQVARGGQVVSMSASLAPPLSRSSQARGVLMDGQFQLRFSLEGLPADTLVSCEAARISLVTASGRRFDQPVRMVETGRLTRLLDGCTNFVLLPKEARALADEPVSIEASVYVTTFKHAVDTVLPIGRRQAVAGYGICVAKERQVQTSASIEPLHFAEVTCDTAFRPPAVVASFKGGLQEAVGYRPDYSPWPAELRLEPVDRAGVTFGAIDVVAISTRSVRAHERLHVSAANVDLRPYQVVQPR